jgi:hypothetical protein
MALEAYNWGGSSKAHETAIRSGQVPNVVKNYAASVLNRADRIQFEGSPELNGPNNYPSSIFEGQSYSRTAGIFGSSVSSAELNFIVPKLNSGLNDVVEAAKEFANKVQKANDSMNFYNGATGQIGMGVN